MSFFSRIINLAGGKLSELKSKDESLSDEKLADELNKIQTPPSAAAQAELTLRKRTPTVPDGDDEDQAPVKKTL